MWHQNNVGVVTGQIFNPEREVAGAQVGDEDDNGDSIVQGENIDPPSDFFARWQDVYDNDNNLVYRAGSQIKDSTSKVRNLKQSAMVVRSDNMSMSKAWAFYHLLQSIQISIDVNVVEANRWGDKEDENGNTANDAGFTGLDGVADTPYGNAAYPDPMHVPYYASTVFTDTFTVRGRTTGHHTEPEEITQTEANRRINADPPEDLPYSAQRLIAEHPYQRHRLEYIPSFDGRFGEYDQYTPLADDEEDWTNRTEQGTGGTLVFSYEVRRESHRDIGLPTDPDPAYASETQSSYTTDIKADDWFLAYTISGSIPAGAYSNYTFRVAESSWALQPYTGTDDDSSDPQIQEYTVGTATIFGKEFDVVMAAPYPDTETPAAHRGFTDKEIDITITADTWSTPVNGKFAWSDLRHNLANDGEAYTDTMYNQVIWHDGTTQDPPS